METLITTSQRISDYQLPARGINGHPDLDRSKAELRTRGRLGKDSEHQTSRSPGLVLRTYSISAFHLPSYKFCNGVSDFIDGETINERGFLFCVQIGRDGSKLTVERDLLDSFGLIIPS
jgi:hypothetical protein